MSDSWIGGDIGGLRAMGTSYKSAKPSLEAAITPVTDQVEALVKDTGWKGEAAERFRATWSEDALTAGAFGGLVEAVGGILETLADQLSSCETALQNAQHTAAKQGVATDPKGTPLQMATSNPPSPADQKALSALSEYNTARTEIEHTAQHARLVAADQLTALCAKVTDPVSTGDKITIADYLRGLYAYDAEDARAGGAKARTEIDAAKSDVQAAKKELRTERKAFQKAGRPLPGDLPAKSAYRDALTKVDSLEESIARADHGSTALPYDRQLNVKLSDAADALRAGKSLEKLPDFLKEVPVLDVAAASACGILEASDDHDKGWSWQHSVAVDGGANLAGLAAGTAVVAGVVAAAPVEIPAAALAVGGGLVVIGTTGVIDHSFHEHWSEDIHDHGVVGGILHGTGNVLSETGDDYTRLLKDTWHGITSLF
ncbi:WXG100 family type VII secretion target [Streptomyces niveiscabiei]|uniref:WXG100 family type VII secretion target n=1 Tax=Streptomyces niveiscabiei TaxID=164115 RepID=A0ABW9HMV4_9ACTN